MRTHPAAPAVLLALAAALAAHDLDAQSLADELGCGACHDGFATPVVIRDRAPSFREGAGVPADFVFAYLADPVRRRPDIGASRMPDFHLSEGERVALALHLGGTPDEGGSLAAAADAHPDMTAAAGARIYRALGCAGCHGAKGGTASPPVGPDLSREGARVRREWLEPYLLDPRPVRTPGDPTSPGSRMPDFRLTPDEAAALGGELAGLGDPFEPAPPPLTPFQARRTLRLLEDRVACLGCHTLQGRGGAIGPSLDGLSQRLRPSFVAEIVLDPQRAAPGAAMPHQRLPAREARRLARLVLDLSRPAPPPPAADDLADADHPLWTRPDTADPGATLYARHCAACHGAAGRGDGWNASSLPVPPTAHADSVLMSAKTDDRLWDGIAAGAWVLDGSARMPPFGDLLGTGEIRSLVRYIRTLCRCAQPSWAEPVR